MTMAASAFAAPRIAMVAGEASGDLLAAHLMQAIKVQLPGARFVGIGGPRMIEEGFDAWWPSETLAVRGYVEVLRHYRRITGVRRQLAERLAAEPPELFIGVDAPDFNLDLEIGLRAKGIRTCHYVSPSIWAWRGERIEKIRRAVDHVLCLFPFEAGLYARAGIAATFVGHPLADMISPDAAGAAARAVARSRLSLPVDAPVVALMPGSRQSELRYLGSRYAEAAVLIQATCPDVRFVVPLASAETEAMWRAAQAAAGAQDLPIQIVQRASHQALAACDVALVASGTATLEAALFLRPMVIAYNMSAVSWAMMRRMKYQPYVGLPNILCSQFVVPELLQEDAEPPNLAQAVVNLINDIGQRGQISNRFRELHDQLRQDNGMRAAGAVMALLRA